MELKETKHVEDSIPRPGSALYNLLLVDESTRKKKINRYRTLNKYLIIPLYRIYLLPLIGFGRIFILITTRGRKTGKRRFTPVEYHRIGGVIHIFSARGEKADWYKNLLTRPDDIEVQIGFHRSHVKGEFVNDMSQIMDVVKWYVTKHSTSAKVLMGWDAKRDDPEKADFTKIAKLLRIVRLHEIPKKSY